MRKWGAIFLITALMCVKGTLQTIRREVSRDFSSLEELNKHSDDEISDEIKLEKRDAPIDIDEGSGELVLVRRKNLKGYMQPTKQPNDYESDFTIDENVNHEGSSSTGNPDEVHDTSSTLPRQTTVRPTTTSREPTIVPKPSCHGIICQNHSVIIQPNHVTQEIGSTFHLKCVLEDKLGNGNATLPENWKVIWTIERYQIPPEEIHESTLTITNSTILDSGIYSCLLKSTDGCCFNKIYIIVNIYQKPDYALHLLITGAICGIQLLACIPFVLYRRRKLNKYTKTDENEDDEQKLIA